MVWPKAMTLSDFHCICVVIYTLIRTLTILETLRFNWNSFEIQRASNRLNRKKCRKQKYFKINLSNIRTQFLFLFPLLDEQHHFLSPPTFCSVNSWSIVFWIAKKSWNWSFIRMSGFIVVDFNEVWIYNDVFGLQVLVCKKNNQFCYV